MHPTQRHTTGRRGDLRRLLRRVALGREREEGERAQAAPPAWPWSLPKLAEGGAVGLSMFFLVSKKSSQNADEPPQVS